MKKYAVILLWVGLMPTHALAQGVSVTGDGAPTQMEALRSRAQQQRQKESEIQLLQMEVDRLKLEVEKKKAMAELGALSGMVEKIPLQSTMAMNRASTVLIKYIFMSGPRQEAVVEMDGMERHVKAGDELPLGVVKSITPQGVILLDKDGQEKMIRFHVGGSD